MSIGSWFKKLFPARVDNTEPGAVSEEKDINEARIDAGGGGALGFPGEPDSHADPAEKIAQSDPEPE